MTTATLDTRPSAILDRAADRLLKPGAWTRKAQARGDAGWPVNPRSKQATCWCASAAIRVECRGDVIVEGDARGFIMRATHDLIEHWNDTPERTQAEVVAELREAAALARSEGR